MISEPPQNTILVSRCLSGAACRYHGRPDRAYCRRIQRIAAELAARIVWFCPEELAGLPTPRPPTRRRRGRYYADGVVSQATDLTSAMREGARRSLLIARQYPPVAVVLFAKSPACDPEWGVAGKLLADAGYRIITLGDLRGRKHLVSRIGCIHTRGVSRVPKPRTYPLFETEKGAEE